MEAAILLTLLVILLVFIIVVLLLPGVLPCGGESGRHGPD